MTVSYKGFYINGIDVTPSLYQEGWNDIVKSGFHPKTTSGGDDDELHHFVATENGEDVGILSVWEDDSYMLSEAVVRMLYVVPEHRNKEIARKLISHAKKWCA